MSKLLRVLVIEDSEDDTLLLMRELQRADYQVEFERVETAESMEKALGNGEWDVVVSDYVLPRFSGLSAIRVIKDSGLDLPFIIVSGKIGENTAVDAMKAGAHDYIMKENLKRLPPAIERELREAAVRRERKAAEEALKTHTARLELMNQELQDFAFAASHDLQEPLRKILNFGSMLSASQLDDAQRGCLDRMMNSTKRMRRLLEDLLQYSRVVTTPDPFQELDFVKVVEGAADVFEHVVKATEGAIEIAELPRIEADESQMIRLFQNLIGNALKFRSDEKPVIRVHAECNTRDTCDIFVEDNGIGFDQEYADRIFKPFQRLHGPSKYDGTGMGLAICRKIVERHGGLIRAESEPGKGSTFIVRMPLRQNKPEVA